jgi:hypothetical protein
VAVLDVQIPAVYGLQPKSIGSVEHGMIFCSVTDIQIKDTPPKLFLFVSFRFARRKIVLGNRQKKPITSKGLFK